MDTICIQNGNMGENSVHTLDQALRERVPVHGASRRGENRYIAGCEAKESGTGSSKRDLDCRTIGISIEGLYQLGDYYAL